MNTNDPKSPEKDPKQSSQEPSHQREPSPLTPPLSSSTEPTRAYSTEPSRTFSSDPSQYAYPPKDKGASAEPSKIYPNKSHDNSRISNEESKSSEYSQKERENQKKYQDESMEDKIRDKFRNKQGDTKKNIDDLYKYAKYNKSQTITYVLLALGLLILFFDSVIGGLLIGGVAGYHFSGEIIYYIRNIGQIAGGQEHLRYITLTILLLGIFIAAPGFFIGAAIVAAFKQVFFSRNQDSDRGKPSIDK